jgi:ribosomal protein S18 acetylase RimI-like enzyme
MPLPPSSSPVDSATTLRPATEADQEFFYRVYASTRAEEVASTGWSAEQQVLFLRHQFAAQTTHYRNTRPDAQVSVIERDGIPAGRLYVDRTVPGEIHVVDISLLPAHRGSGTGTLLLRELQAEARAAGKTLQIYVERYNPALRLYQRLGFTVMEDQGVYLLMEWRAEA